MMSEENIDGDLRKEVLQVLANAPEGLSVVQIASRIFARRFRAQARKFGHYPRMLAWALVPWTGNLYPALYELEQKERRIKTRKSYPKGPWGGVTRYIYYLVPAVA